jgi:hypothetical protein
MVNGTPTSMDPIYSGEIMASSLASVTSTGLGKKLTDFERGNDYAWAEAASIQGQSFEVGQRDAPVAIAFSNILRQRCNEGGLPSEIICKP